jgi:hypothetical protein
MTPRFSLKAAGRALAAGAPLLLLGVGCGSSTPTSDDAISASQSVSAARSRGIQVDNRVSPKTSPLASNCGPAANGTLYRNGEVQPTIAKDPSNPFHLIATYQQDRWSKLGSNGMMTAVSYDLGLNWTASETVPPLTHCTGGNASNNGDYELATDAWLSISPTGTAFAVAFSLDSSTFATAINISRSTDGGFNWQAPVTLIRDTDTEFFDDRPTVTADPYHPGVVYVVWDRVDDTSTDTVEHYTQPLYLARSDDDGKTWGPAHKVYDTAVNTGTIGNEITVLHDGTLLDVYAFVTDTTFAAHVIRSTDKGETWSAPVVLGEVAANPVPDPDGTAVPVRNASLPLLSLDKQTGAVNAVWPTDTLGTTGGQVAFSQSVDGGRTWSAPIQINKSTTSAAVIPVIATDSTGKIGITYYDFRNNTPDPATLPTDFWLSTCSANCTHASSWKESHVAGPFNARVAPTTGLGIMLGDYSGLVGEFGGFLAVYDKTTTDSTNPTNVVSSLIWQ